MIKTVTNDIQLVYWQNSITKINQLMNVREFSAKNQDRSDLYLLMNKDKLPKFQFLRKSLQIDQCENRKSPKNGRIQQGSQQQKQLTDDLSTLSSSLQRKGDKVKMEGKNLQVSNVQDFESHLQQSQKIKKSLKRNQRINPLQSGNNCSSKSFLFIYIAGQLVMNQKKQFQGINPQIIASFHNFINFFDYVLDFKVLKIQSYNPINQDVGFLNVTKSLSPRNKKSLNSLQVQFQQRGAETNNKGQQMKNQCYDKLGLNQSQNARMNRVDNRMPSYQMKDKSQNFNNKWQKCNSTSKIQMEKQPKHFYDVQNPHQHYFQQSSQPNDLTKSQNLEAKQYLSGSRIVTLEQLKKRIDSCTKNSIQNNHEGYFCDECKIEPILGRRYQCVQCGQYDLCQKCYQIQCSKYKIIMRRYDQNLRHNKNKFGPSNNKISQLFKTRPLLKKQMSDILQQQLPSQNTSSQTEKHASSSAYKIEHVHVMEQVRKHGNKKLLDLKKLLRQTNRLSSQSTSGKKSYKGSQKSLKRKMPTIFSWQKVRLAKSGDIMPRFTFSQRTINSDNNNHLGNRGEHLLRQSLRNSEKPSETQSQLKESLG